jgi:hypothetical protein
MLPSEEPKAAERPALTFDRLYLRTRKESGPGVRAKTTHNPVNAANELKVIVPFNHPWRRRGRRAHITFPDTPVRIRPSVIPPER